MPEPRRGDLAWCLVAGLLAMFALVGGWLPAHALEWQMAHALSQPWRWWTAVAVHHSVGHLAGNLLALAAVSWLGQSAGADRTMAWAWVWAWPLTHLGLIGHPGLENYGGLSGVLHAGVAVVGVHLLRVRRMAWGGAVLAVLAWKIVLEQPWGPPLYADESTALHVAPWGHASGAIAGMLCAVTMVAVVRWRRPPPSS